MTVFEVYDLNSIIEEIFKSTSATRSLCDERAASLVNGEITPVPIQGNCSYTVYGGIHQEYVVQFRLDQLELKTHLVKLAHDIYPDLAPRTTYYGLIGDVNDRPLHVYTIDRVPGVNYLEYHLSLTSHENSAERKTNRKSFIEDLAHFFAASWKSPQSLDTQTKNDMKEKYTADMELLLQHLPPRFHPSTQLVLSSLPSIFSRLPLVLLHRDFGVMNIMVNSSSGRLTGVIDWAEAEICPFGQNLYKLYDISGSLHKDHGWRLYEDHSDLQKAFWTAFQSEIGDLSGEIMSIIAAARCLGCLRSYGFTSRLANRPQPVPISEDNEGGRYNLRLLDAFLIDEKTKFTDLADLAKG